MKYKPCWKQIGITVERYDELVGFCRQYPQWKTEAASLLGIRAVNMDGMPHGNGKGDPVAMAAERREQLLRKIGIVDECANKIDDGKWYTVMIQHVCMRKNFDEIDKTLMPTSDRNTFYKQRRKFFELLNMAKD